MPKDEKDTLLKELNDKVDEFNKKNHRQLFLDSVTGALGGGGGGLLAGAAGAAGGLAMATMGGAKEKMEEEKLEAELRSMKFKLMMKMGERGQEISNIEVRVYLI